MSELIDLHIFVKQRLMLIRPLPTFYRFLVNEAFLIITCLEIVYVQSVYGPWAHPKQINILFPLKQNIN